MLEHFTLLDFLITMVNIVTPRFGGHHEGWWLYARISWTCPRMMIILAWICDSVTLAVASSLCEVNYASW